MEQATLNDENGIGQVKHTIGDELGTTALAINHYKIQPGEGLPAGVHAHEQQEEVFVVLEGTATFETLDGPVVVETGETIRFKSGEFQSGENSGSTPLVIIAMSAPKDTGRPLFPFACPECDADMLQMTESGQFACKECAFAATPAPCPECGHEELQAAVTDPPETAAVCQGCGVQFETPPVE